MVSNIKLVTNEMVKKVLKYSTLIPAIEQGFAEFSSGQVHQPVRSSFPVEKHDGYFYCMPVYEPSLDALSVKCVSVFRGNEQKGLKSHQSHIMHFDPTTGALVALMDAEVATEMRTAAASAVATKYLAKENPKVLAILGASAQGYSHIMALCSIYSFDKITIWNRTSENGLRLCKRVESVAPTVKNCSSVAEAVADADVIVTTTLSPTPVLPGYTFKDGVHINCVGACRPHWRELDDECMKRCDLYVDSRGGALAESGDVILSKKEIAGEVGEVVSGKRVADRNKSTVFKSLGLAVQDAIAADIIWKSLTSAE